MAPRTGPMTLPEHPLEVHLARLTTNPEKPSADYHHAYRMDVTPSSAWDGDLEALKKGRDYGIKTDMNGELGSSTRSSLSVISTITKIFHASGDREKGKDGGAIFKERSVYYLLNYQTILDRLADKDSVMLWVQKKVEEGKKKVYLQVYIEVLVDATIGSREFRTVDLAISGDVPVSELAGAGDTTVLDAKLEMTHTSYKGTTEVYQAKGERATAVTYRLVNLVPKDKRGTGGGPGGSGGGDQGPDGSGGPKGSGGPDSSGGKDGKGGGSKGGSGGGKGGGEYGLLDGNKDIKQPYLKGASYGLTDPSPTSSEPPTEPLEGKYTLAFAELDEESARELAIVDMGLKPDQFHIEVVDTTDATGVSVKEVVMVIHETAEDDEEETEHAVPSVSGTAEGPITGSKKAQVDVKVLSTVDVDMTGSHEYLSPTSNGLLYLGHLAVDPSLPISVVVTPKIPLVKDTDYTILPTSHVRGKSDGSTSKWKGMMDRLRALKVGGRQKSPDGSVYSLLDPAHILSQMTNDVQFVDHVRGKGSGHLYMVVALKTTWEGEPVLGTESSDPFGVPKERVIGMTVAKLEVPLLMGEGEWGVTKSDKASEIAMPKKPESGVKTTRTTSTHYPFDLALGSLGLLTTNIEDPSIDFYSACSIDIDWEQRTTGDRRIMLLRDKEYRVTSPSAGSSEICELVDSKHVLEKLGADRDVIDWMQRKVKENKRLYLVVRCEMTSVVRRELPKGETGGYQVQKRVVSVIYAPVKLSRSVQSHKRLLGLGRTGIPSGSVLPSSRDAASATDDRDLRGDTIAAAPPDRFRSLPTRRGEMRQSTQTRVSRRIPHDAHSGWKSITSMKEELSLDFVEHDTSSELAAWNREESKFFDGMTESHEAMIMVPMVVDLAVENEREGQGDLGVHKHSRGKILNTYIYRSYDLSPPSSYQFKFSQGIALGQLVLARKPSLAYIRHADSFKPTYHLRPYDDFVSRTLADAWKDWEESTTSTLTAELEKIYPRDIRFEKNVGGHIVAPRGTETKLLGLQDKLKKLEADPGAQEFLWRYRDNRDVGVFLVVGLEKLMAAGPGPTVAGNVVDAPPPSDGGSAHEGLSPAKGGSPRQPEQYTFGITLMEVKAVERPKQRPAVQSDSNDYVIEEDKDLAREYVIEGTRRDAYWLDGPEIDMNYRRSATFHEEYFTRTLNESDRT